MAVSQQSILQEETWRNFYTQQHKHYCGIDLHARAMYVCILDQADTKLGHKHLPTTPEAFWRVLTPYRADVVVGVACLFTWDGLADLCQQAGLAFVLGHALSMTAIHGGKAKNDKIDAQQIAVFLRGGMFPLASVYPAEMGATRDLLRRRYPLVRNRAALLAPIHPTKSQYNRPELETRLADKANREGGEAPFPAPSVRNPLEVAVSLLAHSDQGLREGELSLTRTAKGSAGQSFARLQSVPGLGPILALDLRYEIQASPRFARGQDFVSSCRLVKGAKDSQGKRRGTSGKKLGNGHLRWAFAEAAGLFLGQNHPGKAYFAQLAHNHGNAQALTVLLPEPQGDSALIPPGPGLLVRVPDSARFFDWLAQPPFGKHPLHHDDAVVRSPRRWGRPRPLLYDEFLRVLKP